MADSDQATGCSRPQESCRPILRPRREDLGHLRPARRDLPVHGSSSDQFLRVGNIENLVHRTALFGILSIGAAFVIITGGIDLSIGSLVCLVGVLLPYLADCSTTGRSPPAVAAVMGMCRRDRRHPRPLITKMRLQPFVVTLCGLLLYRGIARGITGDLSQGFGIGFKDLRSIATSRLPIFGSGDDVFHLPATTLILIIIAIIAAIFLNKTIYGRYLLGARQQSRSGPLQRHQRRTA